MQNDDLDPRSPAPCTGLFEEFNIFGAATGVAAFVRQGEPLPGAPRGFTWRPLSELSIAELRLRAERYRQMAASARTAQAVEGLLKLAERFDALADKRGQGEV